MTKRPKWWIFNPWLFAVRRDNDYNGSLDIIRDLGFELYNKEKRMTPEEVRNIVIDYSAWLTTHQGRLVTGSKFESPAIMPYIEEYMEYSRREAARLNRNDQNRPF